MSIILTISILLLCDTFLLVSQVELDTSYFDPVLGNVSVYDNIRDQTKETLFHGGFIVKDKLGLVISDGNNSGDCGCEPVGNGFWLFFYKNGVVQEQGNFDCGAKVGTWISFYKSGMIKRVSNFTKPYSDDFVLRFEKILNFRRISALRDGQFLEYFDEKELIYKCRDQKYWN